MPGMMIREWGLRYIWLSSVLFERRFLNAPHSRLRRRQYLYSRPCSDIFEMPARDVQGILFDLLSCMYCED